MATAGPPPTARFFRANEVTQKLADVLAPFLGTNMAKSSVSLQLKRMGAGDILTPEQVVELIDKLRPGLGVFVGSAKTAEAVASMQKALGQVGG